MVIVYHELLPESYLLIPAPTADPAAATEQELAQHLSRAVQSGRPAVWVDCRLLDTLSATAAQLLWACHYRLLRRRAQLMLCRVSERVAQALHQPLAGAGLSLCLLPTLDDAAAHTLRRAA